MKLARELVAGVSISSRPKLVASANKIIQRVRAEEEKKLVAALSTINVDWSAPPAVAQPETAKLEVSIATASPIIKAGDDIAITATVKNTGTGPAYRVLPRLVADDNVFADVELPVGKIGPGETKTFTA